MLRSIAAAAAVAALSLTLVTDALAQGRARGGFTGGARMGGPSFRAAGPAFRGNFARGPGFVNPGFRVANPGFRRHGNFRRFGFVGIPLVGAYAGYSYYNNQCIVPQNVLTPYGYQTRWINVCDDYLY